MSWSLIPRKQRWKWLESRANRRAVIAAECARSRYYCTFGLHWGGVDSGLVWPGKARMWSMSEAWKALPWLPPWNCLLEPGEQRRREKVVQQLLLCFTSGWNAGFSRWPKNWESDEIATTKANESSYAKPSQIDWSIYVQKSIRWRVLANIPAQRQQPSTSSTNMATTCSQHTDRQPCPRPRDGSRFFVRRRSGYEQYYHSRRKL